MGLEFPAIAEAPPAVPAIVPPRAAAIVTIKDAAVAHLRAREPEIAALAERYRAVAFDVSTPKGLKAAKDARLELRESGRFAVQRARDATKDLLNDTKRDVDAEAERLIAIVRPVEDHVHGQIEAREKAIAEERAREQARKDRHLANIATLAGYATQAYGKPLDKLVAAIDFVTGIDVSEASFEEYAGAAAKAKADTLEQLARLRGEAEEAERQRHERERVAEEQRVERARLKAEAEEIARQKRAAEEELARQREQLARERAELEALRKPAAVPAPERLSAPLAQVLGTELGAIAAASLGVVAPPEFTAAVADAYLPSESPAAEEPAHPVGKLDVARARIDSAVALGRRYGFEEHGVLCFTPEQLADLIDHVQGF